MAEVHHGLDLQVAATGEAHGVVQSPGLAGGQEEPVKGGIKSLPGNTNTYLTSRGFQVRELRQTTSRPADTSSTASRSCHSWWRRTSSGTSSAGPVFSW